MILSAGSLARLASTLCLALLGTPLAGQAAGLEQRRTLELDGERRTYLLHVPSSYRQTRALPLVLVFHAAGGSGPGMARHTGLSRVAEREGFTVAYPDGIGRRWNDGRGLGGGRDDVAFVRRLIDTLSLELGIDGRRIYATGISNGAMFTHRLACDLPGVLAAIAPVAGAVPAALADRCGGTAPVSVVSFQGTADQFMPYEGGGGTLRGGAVLGAEPSAAFWARIDGCRGSPTPEPPVDTVTDGTRVRRTVWAGCGDGLAVVLYTVEGGGHTWPGGPAAARRVGRASREIDATETIWTFFQRHPRP